MKDLEEPANPIVETQAEEIAEAKARERPINKAQSNSGISPNKRDEIILNVANILEHLNWEGRVEN